MLLTDAITAYLAARCGLISAKTTRLYRQSLDLLSAHLGDIDIAAITLDDLRAFRTGLFNRSERYYNGSRPRENGPLSHWTIHGHIRVVRQLFRWLYVEGKIATNVAARLELPELGNEPPKGISEADLNAMLAVAAASHRDHALLLFLADTGARVGGVAGLRIDDLELDRGRAVVHEKGRRGRVRSRVVYLSENTVAAIRAWLFDRRSFVARRAKRWLRLDDGYVFVSNKGSHLSESGIYELLERIAERAGVSGRCNPHAFRHGLARALLERGCDLSRVSQILGHSSIVVTARFYGRFADDELRQAHDAFSWVGRSDKERE